MLVITRFTGQNIVIDGGINIKILSNTAGTVRLGIEAPPNVSVHRQEIFDQIGNVRLPKTTRPHQRHGIR